ncbi:putative membrane-bound dehydrogenase domain-containing protein [Neorhodopirellula lusitana]|uniref:Membrane-bound dehydrogenase domain-containing protein n=1 Tax=Neorhodopirellula lusitana TaxID=445327 RepID=A0ABY1PN64_9BACT|nr:PVC-type heme-binding CxxCH protein [Neorhodopirellula lusitana]SMP38071.1 putative membrane-bound dehydrogenase domain-containing protein [Neorhodopirellula lusitana]
MNSYTRITHLQIVVASLSVVFALAFRTGLAQEDYAAELPRVPPTPPSETLKDFHIAKGFQIQLVASEPLVNSPVAMEWAADGSLFVCEMRGYSEDQDAGISRISRLVDTDRDGIEDTSTIFVDGLLWPTGLFPWEGGLFVGDAPNLYYFRDTDGDGTADQREVVLTGFGTSNVQGLFNSFRWGLDNRIHIACSSTGGMIRRPDQPESAGVNVRGRDIALDPRTGEFELTSGAAQHGMCFDNWGRKFVSSNSNHLQQVMYEDHYISRNQWLQPAPARVSIAEDGPQAEVFRTSPIEPWRIVRTRLRVSGKSRGPIEGGGRAAGYFTGATGVTIVRGDAWPESFQGMAIIGDVGSNLVHRKRLHANGLKWIGKRVDTNSELVTSSDIWFRPAQFANAPDGSLHIIDVCREVIEHPKSLPAEIKQHLDLTSGRDRGRLYRLIPDDFKYRPTPNLRSATDEELVNTLAHPNAWHRETASRLLVERQSTAHRSLREMTRQPTSALGRLHALAVLDGIGKLNTEIVLSRLSDSHPMVRRFAIRLAEKVPANNALRTELATLASDPSVEVRYQLAFTAGSIQEFDRTPVLASIIRQNPTDRWMQTAVQSSVGTGAGELFSALLSATSDSRLSQMIGRLASQISQQNHESDTRLALDAVLKLSPQEGRFALPILGQLLQTRSRSGSVLHQLASAGELTAIDQVMDEMLASLEQLALDESASNAIRVNAISNLRYAAPSQVSKILPALTNSRHPMEVQRAAMTTWGRFDSPQITTTLLEEWSGFSPSLRETAAEILFAKPDRLLALLTAIDSGDIPMSELSRSRLQVAAKSKDSSIHQLSTHLLNSSGSKDREKVVQSYQNSLQIDGDMDRGRQLFTTHCANCHRLENHGHEIGPNLATVKARGADFILANVLDPNREVNPQYLNYVALDINGRTLTGMITDESATSITLQRAESAKDELLRVDVELLQSTGMSIMPEGFEAQLNRQAMADLIRYLLEVK